MWQEIKTDSTEIKTEDAYKILAAIKKCLILVIIWLSQNTVMIQVN